VEVAEQATHQERAGILDAGAALREAFFGNSASPARGKANAALRLSKDREVEYGTVLALAISGESSMSATLAEDLEKRFAEDNSAAKSVFSVATCIGLLDSFPSSSWAFLIVSVTDQSLASLTPIIDSSGIQLGRPCAQENNDRKQKTRF